MEAEQAWSDLIIFQITRTHLRMQWDVVGDLQRIIT